MTWHRSTKKLAPAVVSVAASLLHNWGPKDEGFCKLDGLRDMAQN